MIFAQKNTWRMHFFDVKTGGFYTFHFGVCRFRARVLKLLLKTLVCFCMFAFEGVAKYERVLSIWLKTLC